MEKDKVKVLFVGNSFSTDATRYLEQIADGELFVRNLYIGGCSLEMHVNNIHTDAEPYEYQENAERIKNSSLTAGLLAEEWDIISVQQVSQQSGFVDSYEPYIGELIAFIRKCAPRAELVFHRTWAYAVDSTHPGFAAYNCDQALMDSMITKASSEISEKYSLRVIPSGVAVALARANEMFAYSGGIPLDRDGFHLSLTHGRYLAGLVCYRALTGKCASSVGFIPEGVGEEEARVLREIADKAFD